ncbi:MAG: J domain-containing protein [Sphingomicrobium sp.]
MAGDACAYQILGLEPGAELAAIERAYKSLIKAHHPDRAGGDPARAADLNRAYNDLRQALRQRGDVAIHSFPPLRAAGWSATIWALVAVVMLGLAAATLSLLTPREAARIAGISDRALVHAARLDVMEQPLSLGEIDRAALEAVRISQRADELTLTAHSNRCFQLLRRSPALVQYDRCAAFDDAVVLLQDRDPLRDSGRFSEIAVTGRLWSAAATLSKDYVATDSRLRRIRLQVELLLSPDEASSAVQ